MKDSAEAFSSIDQVAQCMSDDTRSIAFQRAIHSVVKPGHRVIDVGTGSGLLAMFAAQAGAKEIVGIEYDPFVAATARANISHNGYDKRIEVVEADATNFGLPGSKPFDVVLMELLTTGMIDEVQIPAINNLYRQGLVHEHTIFVPSRVTTYACLAQVDYNLYGLDMRMIRHLWFDFPETHATRTLTDEQILSDLTFRSDVPLRQRTVLSFTAVEEGSANALLLKTRCELSDGVELWDTLTLNAPVIIPIGDTKLSPRQSISLELSYTFGGGYSKLHVEEAQPTSLSQRASA